MKIFKPILVACALLLGASAAMANDQNAGSGTVAETMTAGGYVYVRLAEDGTWLAASQAPVAVGDKVEYAGGMLMQNFTSRSLDRTFENILFVSNLKVGQGFDADAHAAAAVSNQQFMKKTAVAEAPKPGEITPLEDGKTIAGIYAESESLKDQKTALRARVMKVSKNIMGKHWVTLQDGTGQAPGDRLIATTQEEVAVGDLVTASGVIHTDVDLGSGYNYAVLIEDVTFSK